MLPPAHASVFVKTFTLKEDCGDVVLYGVLTTVASAFELKL